MFPSPPRSFLRSFPLIVLFALTSTRSTLAQEALAPKPSPYALPFQLRPAVAGNVLRSDSSFAFYENAIGQRGFAAVSGLLGALRIPGTGEGPGTGLSALAKLSVAGDSPPGTATGGFAFVNPLVAISYSAAVGNLRASAFLGVTIPVGMGGGDSPDKGALDARTVGVLARASMENALFAVNDLTLIPGVDLAWVAQGVTVQLEATVFQLERVRGAAAQPEASKTNFTTGMFIGAFLTKFLSFGGELRYQRWINPPFAVQTHKPNASVDEVSLSVGPRLHLKLASDVWFRPGIAYTRGFEHPMTSPGNYDIVQLDLPFSF